MPLSPELSPPLVLVCLCWSVEDAARRVSTGSSLWASWIIEAPADWSLFMAELNGFSWPAPFSRDPSKIIPYGPQPMGFGARAPMFSVIQSSPAPRLVIGLDARAPIPSDLQGEGPDGLDWERRLWSVLQRDAIPRLDALMSELSPLYLGLRLDDGASSFQHSGPADVARWESLREKSLLSAELREPGPRGPPAFL